MENCSSCDDKICYTCIKGFSYNTKTNKCEKCKIKNCLWCGDNH